MAVMNMNIQNRVNSPMQSIASTTDTARTDAQKSRVQSEDSRAKRQLEDVVSTSQDGDTLQVSRDAAMRANGTNEGAVTMRGRETESTTASLTDDRNATADAARERLGMSRNEDNQRSNETDNRRNTADTVAQNDRMRGREIAQANIEKSNQEASDNKQQKVTSLAGYTKMQIDQLYREGRISQQDYDAQMQKRQDQLEEASAKSSELANTGAVLDSAKTRNELDNLSIRVTFSENSSDKIDAAQRFDAMQNIRQAQEGPAAQRTRNEERRLWDYQLQV